MRLAVNSTQKNLIGSQIRELRTARRLTQYQLAAKLQLQGYNFNELTILRIEKGQRLVTDIELSIEKGQRLVTDIELKILCTFFQVDPNTLLGFRS